MGHGAGEGAAVETPAIPWAHTFLPADHLLGPLPEEEDLQGASVTPSRDAWSWG